MGLFSRKRDNDRVHDRDTEPRVQQLPKNQVVVVNQIPDRQYKVLNDDGYRLQVEDMNTKEVIIVLKEDTQPI